MNIRLLSKITLLVLLVTSAAATAGCSRKNVRHLASDVCMISKGISQQEVLTYLGHPDERKAGAEGETWVYYQVNKSILRKTPFIGDNLGSENVEMATVQFAGDKVITCVYRSIVHEEKAISGATPAADESGSK